LGPIASDKKEHELYVWQSHLPQLKSLSNPGTDAGGAYPNNTRVPPALPVWQ